MRTLPVVLAALIVTLLIAVPSVTADPLTPKAADKLVTELLKKEGARPGGILRVRRFPALVGKGWTVAEAKKDTTVKLTAAADSYFYYIDRKAGPRYAHAVEYLLVDKASGKTTRKAGDWWPEVRDAKGEPVEKADGKPLISNKGNWYNDPAHVVIGDKGPSIQDAQGAVKFKWMFAKLPPGSRAMIMYSCPATLPKDGTVWADGKQVFKAKNDTFLMYVEFHRGKPFPKNVTLVCYDRTTKKPTNLTFKHAPVMKDAKGKAITTDDGGKKLGAWYADNAHSFLTRMSFGGR